MGTGFLTQASNKRSIALDLKKESDREVLKKLDDLGIADNTILVYGTDNGAETATWPDGGVVDSFVERI